MNAMPCPTRLGGQGLYNVDSHRTAAWGIDDRFW